MSGLLNLLGKKLTPELLAQVRDSLGDDFDFDWVPRARLNKVLGQRDALRSQLAAQTQGDDGEGDDDDVINEGPKGAGQIMFEGKQLTEKDIKKLLKQKDDDQKKALKDLEIRYAVLDKLRSDGALDPELVFQSVLDRGLLGLDEKGVLTGYDDQVAEVKKNKAFLFNPSEGSGSGSGDGDGAPGGTGRSGAEGGINVSALDAQLNQIFGIPTEE